MIQQILGDTKYLRAIEEKEAEFPGEERILAWLSDEKIALNLKYTLSKLENNPIKQPDEIPKGYELPVDWFRDTVQTWLQDKTADNVFWLHGRREYPVTLIAKTIVLDVIFSDGIGKTTLMSEPRSPIPQLTNQSPQFKNYRSLSRGSRVLSRSSAGLLLCFAGARYERVDRHCSESSIITGKDSGRIHGTRYPQALLLDR